MNLSDMKLNDFIKKGAKNIVFINGLKGGTGKSVLALVLEYLYSNINFKIVIVDMDMSNEDVLKACGNVSYKTRIDGTTPKGWEALDGIVHDHEFDLMIINTPAQFDHSLADHGIDWLTETNENENLNLITVWSLGSYRDSTLLLNKYLKFNTGEPVFVALSMHEVDDETDFEVFNEKQSGDKPLDLRGGSVLHNLRLPKKLLNRMKDGTLDETGKIVRVSIAQFLEQHSSKTAGSYIKRPLLRTLDNMRLELGINNKDEDDLSDE